MSELNETKEISLGNGKSISVAQLPIELRQGVEFFDKLKADLDDANYKQNVLMVATQAWNNKLMTDIGEFLKPEQEEDKDADADESAESAETEAVTEPSTENE